MSCAIEDHGLWRMEHRAGGRLVVAIVAVAADAGERGNHARLPIDLADAVAALVDENDVALPVHGNADDVVEAGLHRGLAVIQIHRHVEAVRADRHEPAVIVAEIDADGVAREDHEVAGHERLLARIIFGGPGAGHRRHEARAGVVAADLVGLRVGDVQHIVLVEGHGRGPREIDLERRTIAVKAMLAGADDRGDHAGVAVDFADAVAAGVADVEIVLGIEGDVERQIEPRFTAGPFVAAVAGFTDAGEIVQRALLKVDAPDAV